MQLLNNLQANKISCYIGFAVKSNAVIWGLDKLKSSKKPPFIILIDEELGANSKKQVELYSQRNNVRIVALEHNFLDNLLKRNNVKILSIIDNNLANAILKSIN